MVELQVLGLGGLTVRAAKSLLLLLCVIGLDVRAWGDTTNTTVDVSNKWAWASPVGWINCRTDTTNGATFGEFVCKGYFWSSGTGWINLGDGTPTNGIRYTNLSSDDFGVNCYSNGMLRGSAWSPTYGWISFEGTGAPKIDYRSGVVSGYAWNSGLGWMSFTNVNGFVENDSMWGGTDTESNSIPDAWELTYTNVVGVIGSNVWTDSDNDGETDRREYIAGTNPLDGNDYLHITAAAGMNGTNDLTWTCVPTRTYLVETNCSLTNGAGWLPSDLGKITTNSTSNVTIRLSMGDADSCFYRVRAFLPLSVP
jgi:hypothetical protein